MRPFRIKPTNIAEVLDRVHMGVLRWLTMSIIYMRTNTDDSAID